jgi:hypothetical protein
MLRFWVLFSGHQQLIRVYIIQIAECDADLEKSYMKKFQGVTTIASYTETTKFLLFYDFNFFGNFCNFSKIFVFLGASYRIYVIKYASKFILNIVQSRIDKVEKFSF